MARGSGGVSILGGGGGDRTGEARGSPVLDLVGAHVVTSHMDDEERLHLRFGDGRVRIAEPDTWEAHRLAADGGWDEHWVPREGPRIP